MTFNVSHLRRVSNLYSGARHLSKFWANKEVGGAEDDVSLEKILGS